MKKEFNIVGTRIGIYDVLYECDYKAKDGHRLFRIRCSECGWETDYQPHQIKNLCQKCTHVNSAGRYTPDMHKIRLSNKRIRNIYTGMIQRCYNQNEKSYAQYGAKGIKVCDEWLDNPKSFEDWSIKNGYKDDLTIDRIDSSKDYSPNNCRWVTFSDNARYKSTTRLTTVDGLILTGREWADELNIGTNTINNMFKEHPYEQVVEFIRRRKQDKTKTRKGKTSWFEVYGIE